MKTHSHPKRARGYTLIELAMAMGIGIVTAGMTLALFNQQISFLKIFKAQDFLVREAPLINNYVVRAISTAEGFQLYQDMDSLRNGASPVLSGATVLVMRFRETDNTTGTDSVRDTILSFEDPGTGAGLYYRVIPSSGMISTPDWAVSKQPTLVSFAIEQGILRMYMTGPNGEQLVYSGTDQL